MRLCQLVFVLMGISICICYFPDEPSDPNESIQTRVPTTKLTAKDIFLKNCTSDADCTLGLVCRDSKCSCAAGTAFKVASDSCGKIVFRLKLKENQVSFFLH